MDDPNEEVEMKPQLKPRGSVAKKKDPKPSQQLYKLQTKSTQSTKQTPSMEYVHIPYVHIPLRVPTKENTLTLRAVGTGGKNTQEQDQIRI